MQLSSSGTRRNAKPEEHFRKFESTSRFKWWFENVDRILRSRQHEIRENMGIADDEIDKWTHGYDILSELVFAFKGMSLGSTQLSIMKWRADFSRQHVWAGSEAVQEALHTPQMTEEERAAHAEKVRERKAQKRRAQKAKRKVKEGQGTGQDDALDEALDNEEGREAARTFEELLAAMKTEGEPARGK